MIEAIRRLYALAVLNTPLLRKACWDEQIDRHTAILDGAFENDPYAQLLTLRLLEAMNVAQDPQRAARLIDQLGKRARLDADHALHCVLRGQHHMLLDQLDGMEFWYHQAEKHGHHFHMPHVMLGLCCAFELHRYDDALAEFNKAIDCLYGYRPLTDEVQRLIARVQANCAYVLTMMQRPDEAQAALLRAGAAREQAEYLRAAALLHAVQGDRAAAEQAMSALKAADPDQHETLQALIPPILDGTHPHFFAKAHDVQQIRAYWDWFAAHEEELIRIIREDGDAWAFQDAAFMPLAPEENDNMTVSFAMDGDTPCVTWAACYSCNYDALITALIAECPAQLKARWRIGREN